MTFLGTLTPDQRKRFTELAAPRPPGPAARPDP
jgi:hypothetical protein